MFNDFNREAGSGYPCSVTWPVSEPLSQVIATHHQTSLFEHKSYQKSAKCNGSFTLYIARGALLVMYVSPGNVFPAHISLGMRVSPRLLSVICVSHWLFLKSHPTHISIEVPVPHSPILLYGSAHVCRRVFILANFLRFYVDTFHFLPLIKSTINFRALRFSDSCHALW